MVLKQFAHEQSVHLSKWLDLNFNSDEYFSYVYEHIPKVGEYCHLVNRLSIKLQANDTKYLEDNLSFFAESSSEQQIEYLYNYVISVFNSKSWHCKPLFVDTRNLNKNQFNLNRILDICCRLHCPILLYADKPLKEDLIKQVKYLSARSLFNIILDMPSLRSPVCKELYQSDFNLFDRVNLLKQCSRHTWPVGAIVGPIIPQVNDFELEEITSFLSRYTNHISYKFVSENQMNDYDPKILSKMLSVLELEKCRTYVNNCHGKLSILMEEEQYIERYERIIAGLKQQFNLTFKGKKLSTYKHKSRKSSQLCFF